MIGYYNSAKTELYTEKLAGGITACMDFVIKNGYYILNTALKEDIRDISQRPQQRVLCVLRKNVSDTFYNEICYTVKGISINDIQLPKETAGMIVLK